MRKLVPFLVIGFAALALAQDGPLTNGANIPVRTDANGYLMAAAQTYTGPDGPRRVFANTLVRTDANGYLIVTNPTGFGGGGMEIGGDVTSGTAGSVLFVGAGPVLAQDNANFFYDDSTNRLGLGDTTPSQTIDAVGNIAATGSLFLAGVTTVNDREIRFVFDGNAAFHNDSTNGAAGMVFTGAASTSGFVTFLSTSGAGTTDFINFRTGNNGAVEAMHIDTSGNVGINTTPSARFDVIDNTNYQMTFAQGAGGLAQATLTLYAGITGGQGGVIIGKRSSGSIASPAAIGVNEEIFRLAVVGYHSGGAFDSVRRAMTVNAGENWTSSAMGYYYSFLTRTNGTAGGPTERLRITDNGNVIVGTTNAGTGTQGLIFEDGTALASMGSNTTGLYGDDVGGTVRLHAIDEAGNVQRLVMPQTIVFAATTQANLGTPANGTVAYCSDCTIANPCAAAGTGAIAKRLNGVWVCN